MPRSVSKPSCGPTAPGGSVEPAGGATNQTSTIVAGGLQLLGTGPYTLTAANAAAAQAALRGLVFDPAETWTIDETENASNATRDSLVRNRSESLERRIDDLRPLLRPADDDPDARAGVGVVDREVAEGDGLRERRTHGSAGHVTDDVPVVVQHTRLDSRQEALALLSTVAYPCG